MQSIPVRIAIAMLSLTMIVVGIRRMISGGEEFAQSVAGSAAIVAPDSVQIDPPTVGPRLISISELGPFGVRAEDPIAAGKTDVDVLTIDKTPW